MVNSIQNRINNLLPPQAHTFSNWPQSYAHSQQNLPFAEHNNQHLNPHYTPSQHNSHQSLSHRYAPPQHNGHHPRQSTFNHPRPSTLNQPRPHTSFNRTNPVSRSPPKWTPDGRPVCLSCQRPGHIRRDCRSLTQTPKAPRLN